MKKFFIFSVLSLLTIGASVFAQDESKNVVVDENAEVRTVPDFKGISVSSATIVYISQGTENAVAVSCGDESKNDKIVTEVKDGILKIYFGKSDYRFFVNRNYAIKAYITVTNLEFLDISGASIVKFIDAVKVTNLKADISGASVLKGEVKGEEISIDASGASSVSLTGKVAKSKLEASGASVIKAYELETTDFSVVGASGASTVHANANHKISMRASGASSIKYKGNCTEITMHESGASSIKKVD